MRIGDFVSVSLACGAVLICGCGLSYDAERGAEKMDSPTVHPEIWPAIDNPVPIDPEIEGRIDDLLARMSVEDKVGQVVQGEIRHLEPKDVRKYRLGSVLNGGGVQPFGKKWASVDDWLELADAFWEASMDTSDGGLAIPIIWGTDAVHGHTNVFGATVFPQNIGLGAARNPELIHEIGRITALEIAVSGLDWDFSPTVAVVRDDRWGRAYESWSEDPEVARSYAGEMVRGLQGKAASGGFLADDRVVACSKHFLGDGGTLNGVDRADNLSTEAELRDIHGAGYFSALETGVQTVMASFSSWQGLKMHGNRGLLTDVLKGRMGFDGFVVGDWNGHADVEGCSNSSCPAAFNAGVDMFMAPEDWKALRANTIDQVKSGEISMERLDDAVRRILRVKMRTGLFDKGKPSSRPMAGKTEYLGSAEHRAVARQAVRESLVLLKNNGGLLPLERSQTVLVAGDGAHNIGKQSGGWTLTWQGTDTTNEDFPGASSVWDGIKRVVEDAGGTAILSEDGSFRSKPDVAVVVFGEEPYAEFQGDRETLDYGFSRPDDLKLLKKLNNAGVPVVSIFLSGRPMWVNPELNESDAFVAAWLPGSEGDGVAEVIFNFADGAIHHDFKGTLAHSWPKTAVQESLNLGDEGYDPLFAYGFGLTYADDRDLDDLPEDPGGAIPDAGRTVYFRGGPVAPWQLFVGDSHFWAVKTVGGNASTWDRDNLVVTAVDRELQEDARAARWAGYDLAHVYLEAAQAVDLTPEASECKVLAFEVMVEEPPSAPVYAAMRCGEDCEGRIDITEALVQSTVGEWRTMKLRLRHFADGGADLSHVTTPFLLATEGSLALRFADVRLEPAVESGVPCD
ncbi:MAG: glycoside hydrolase family 3 protein [Acidobacteria bacterium]|nr:glycoside hydrolase family 3 protein [Candidatus Sulfomarinibacter kjeldsenii]